MKLINAVIESIVFGRSGIIFEEYGHSKGETGQGLDCAHPLVFNNGAPISWAGSIMSVYT